MSPGSRPSQGRRPARTTTIPTTAITSPMTIRARPRSFTTAPSSLKQRALARGRPGRRLLAEMRVALAGDPPAARLPGDEADLQEIRLHDLGQRLGVVVDGGRYRLDP